MDTRSLLERELPLCTSFTELNIPMNNFISILYKETARHPLEPRGLILCPERQSMQNALLCLQSEKTKNHRQAVIYPIVQDKRRVNTLFPVSVSVIFRFLLSAYHLLFTARLCLKQLFSSDTATLYCLYTPCLAYSCLLLQFTLCSLP